MAKPGLKNAVSVAGRATFSGRRVKRRASDRRRPPKPFPQTTLGP